MVASRSPVSGSAVNTDPTTLPLCRGGPPALRETRQHASADDAFGMGMGMWMGTACVRVCVCVRGAEAVGG